MLIIPQATNTISSALGKNPEGATFIHQITWNKENWLEGSYLPDLISSVVSSTTRSLCLFRMARIPKTKLGCHKKGLDQPYSSALENDWLFSVFRKRHIRGVYRWIMFAKVTDHECLPGRETILNWSVVKSLVFSLFLRGEMTGS